MKYVHSDELDTIANSISNDLLLTCLEVLTLQYTWRMSSNATFENIEDFHIWIHGRFPFVKDDGNICVIFKTEDFERLIYSTYVPISPFCLNFLSQLASELRRIINLKAFL